MTGYIYLLSCQMLDHKIHNMLKMVFGLVLVFAAFILKETTATDSCKYYQFEIQPPLTLTCDPYHRVGNSDSVAWRLRFDCEVSRLSNSAGSFDVHWFRRDPDTQAITDLGRLRTVQSEPDELEIRYGEHILNSDFMDSMLGDYWCQVINTTIQPHTYLGMSNVLTILHPDQYDLALPDCELVENEAVACADVMMAQESILPSLSSFSSMHHQSTDLHYSSSLRASSSSQYLVNRLTNTAGILTSTTNEEQIRPTSTDEILSVLPTSSVSITTSVLNNERIIQTMTSTFNEHASSRITTQSSFITTPSSFVMDASSQTGITATITTGTVGISAGTIGISAGTTGISTGTTGISTGTILPGLPPTPSSSVPESMASTSSSNVFISQSESPMAAQDLLVTGFDTNLLLAASVGGAMLILIIILLTIIMVLLCTTNKKRTSANSSGSGCGEDKENEFQRMSSLRSSQRPLLLESTSISPDSQQCFATAYTCGDMIPDHTGASAQPHHYSVIRDSSFEPNPVPTKQHKKQKKDASHQQSAASSNGVSTFVIPEMTENQFYSSKTQEEQFTDSIGSHNMNLEGAAANQYSSLRKKSSDKSPQSDGYNKLRQQKPLSPSDNGAYSTLYDPNITSPQTSPRGQLDTTGFPVMEPYNTLNHSTTSINPPPLGRNEPSFKVLSPSNGRANIYDEVLNEQNPSTSGFDDPQYYSSVVQPTVKSAQDKKQSVTKNQQPPSPVADKKKKTKTAAILPPQYRGDYERDPNYVPQKH